MNKSRNNYMKGNKGITLIALVVTIIILIILAGISINLVLGENGIIQKSKSAKELSEEQTAKEKLSIELQSLLVNKETSKNYNDEIFDEYLINKGFSVNGDIVICDGWQFQVDKSVPEILTSLGRGKINNAMKIEISQELATDYTKSTINIAVTYEGKLTQININGEKIEIPESVDGVYTITKEITENKTYSVLVKDENENYNISNIKVSEVTENMEIKTKDDLKAFVGKLNQGATFQGKTVTLMNNIDINEGKWTIEEGLDIVFAENAEQWPLLSTTTTEFQGTFEGGYNTIKGLYIVDVSGMFYHIGTEGKVSNLKLQGSVLNSITYTGLLCAQNKGIIENCGIEKGSSVIRTI